MRTIVRAALVAACIPRPAQADVGPPKHWNAFPGRAVRAVSFRGYSFGREPAFTVVQGRDGNVYLRGLYGLYRVHENGAEPQRVADTSRCEHDAHGTDTRPMVPVAICARAQDIIIAAASGHRHIPVPYPDPARRPYPYDHRAITDVVPAPGGGYWFAYGERESVGRLWPSGRSVLSRYPGLGTFYHIVAGAGDDVYAVDNGCRAVQLRARATVPVLPAYRGCTWYSHPVVVTGDGAVWLLGDGTVERRTAAGTPSRWELGLNAYDVAVTRDGTAFVLGSGRGQQGPAHPMVAAIPRHGMPATRGIPMRNAYSIAVDARDRLWITDFIDHAAAMISPPGGPH